jgi:hypothetical protein
VLEGRKQFVQTRAGFSLDGAVCFDLRGPTYELALNLDRRERNSQLLDSEEWTWT